MGMDKRGNRREKRGGITEKIKATADCSKQTMVADQSLDNTAKTDCGMKYDGDECQMGENIHLYRVANIKAPLDTTEKDLKCVASRALHIKEEEIAQCRMVKRSIDARDKGDVHLVLTLEIGTHANLRAPRGVQMTLVAPVRKEVAIRPRALSHRPLIVGLGPAGLFAGLTLARLGLEPLIIERGRDVDSRSRDIALFHAGGPLDPDSNVQFGEGGAGAFSDGKLNTGISDPRCRMVLEDLVEAGAPEEILYDAKPHIGTDRLPGVVRNIREKIRLLGGEIWHEARLTDILIENGRVVGAQILRRGETVSIETDDILLAIGHSARDTLEMLLRRSVPMERKPFSIGARIEQKQANIDRAQYGKFAGHKVLGAADYKMNTRTSAGRGVYTFCMCPGGTVVAAASEQGRLCTNGMSEYARDGENANAALLVGVDPADFGEGDVLAGVRFQRKWEERAFAYGGGKYLAPAQLVSDFLQNVPSGGAGNVQPSYRPGVVWGNMSDVLPLFVHEAMREALPKLDRMLHGFAAPDAVLTGVETRSSSPVRILRGATFESEIAGLYPCGEGAGYAGGILSAAVDGMRCAQALAGVLPPKEEKAK